LSLDGARHATEAAASPSAYIDRVRRTGTGFAEMTTLAPAEAAQERLLMGLRIDDGVGWDEVAVFGLSPDAARVRALRELGLIADDPARLRVTRAGRLVLDRLTAELAG
jgi:coproporphyrinogen III oxidase-like Fe-S oxidoreductase